MQTYKGPLKELPPNSIFVFGSNTEGRHGKGAALWARLNAGAIYGQARGLQGSSYAIITKDLTKQRHPSISKNDITKQIEQFYQYIKDCKELGFEINAYVAYMDTPNLNGYTPQEMADMFKAAGNIPSNVIFEQSFSKLF
jgi:hypothetical protein